jgi:hypothetical protein
MCTEESSNWTLLQCVRQEADGVQTRYIWYFSYKRSFVRSFLLDWSISAHAHTCMAAYEKQIAKSWPASWWTSSSWLGMWTPPTVGVVCCHHAWARGHLCPSAWRRLRTIYTAPTPYGTSVARLRRRRAVRLAGEGRRGPSDNLALLLCSTFCLAALWWITKVQLLFFSWQRLSGGEKRLTLTVGVWGQRRFCSLGA